MGPGESEHPCEKEVRGLEKEMRQWKQYEKDSACRVALRMEEGATSQGLQASSGSLKRPGTSSPLEPPEAA